MSKKYIKLNNNNSHLSLGNLFNIIKKNSINKSNTNQIDIFNSIFEDESINETTINNYCTGYRSIGNKYKQQYIILRKKYQSDEKSFIKIINNIISLITGEIKNYNINEINKIKYFENICKSLLIVAKNDKTIDKNTINTLNKLINKNDYYNFFIKVLLFVILEKKQPIYESDEYENLLIEFLNNNNISLNELKKFLSFQLEEGINYTYTLKKLAQERNPYACFEIGNMELYGQIDKYPRYEEAFKYYKIASESEHPTAYWRLGHLIITGKVGNKTKEDLTLAWEYLNKAMEKGSIAAINSIGYAYLNGLVPPHFKKDENTAIKYFKIAANKNYVYSYNNLGLIYENKKDYETAFKYFKKSADLNESWAANKVGLYYYEGKYVKKELQKSYEYFKISSDVPYRQLQYYSKFNLATKFYMHGCPSINISKNETLAISYLEECRKENIIVAQEYLLYYYIENNKINETELLIKEIENNKNYNNEIAERINKKINELKNKKKIIYP